MNIDFNHIVDKTIKHDTNGWYSTSNSVYYTDNEIDSYELP